MTKAQSNRKAISPKVWKRLFAESGNICAYSPCGARLVGPDGQRDYEVAHIFGVEPNSARFSATKTRDELATADNLLLVCHKHNTYIDDRDYKDRFTVTAVRSIKQAHVARMQTLQSTIRLHSAGAVVTLPATFARIDTASGLNLTLDADIEAADEINGALIAYSERVRRVPPRALEFFAAFLESAQWERNGVSIPPVQFVSSLPHLMNLADAEVWQLLRLLQAEGLADQDDDEETNSYVMITGRRDEDVLVTLRLAVQEGWCDWPTLISQLDWSQL